MNTSRRSLLAGAAASIAAIPVATEAVAANAVPTRVSTHKMDVGYKAWQELEARGLWAKVFVDDKEADLCFTADTSLGYADIAIPHPKDGGIFVIDGTDEIAMKRIYGSVRLELISAPAWREVRRYNIER